MKAGDWVKERGSARKGVVLKINEESALVQFVESNWYFPTLAHLCITKLCVIKTPKKDNNVDKLEAPL